jgi:hypothetical protein
MRIQIKGGVWKNTEVRVVRPPVVDALHGQLQLFANCLVAELSNVIMAARLG